MHLMSTYYVSRAFSQPPYVIFTDKPEKMSTQIGIEEEHKLRWLRGQVLE